MSAVVRRPVSVHPRSERRAGQIPRLLVLLAIALLAATCGGPAPTTSPAGRPMISPAGTGPAPSSAASTPGVTPLPTSSPDDTGWSRLELPALAQVARLTATRAGPASVAPTTAFRLTSLAGSPVRQLAERLTVRPAIDLRVMHVDGDTAVLKPTTRLQSGQIYRFELRRSDGTAEAAWAVQAAWPLHVASSLPGDQTTGVPRTTGIEVTFDQAGVRLADFKAHVSVTPKVIGRFEQHGLTFVLVPTDPLKARTLYTITVRHGLPLAETGMTLEADQVIHFETVGGAVSRMHVSMVRPLFDSSTREQPALGIFLDSEDEDEQASGLRQLSVSVSRLAGLSAAIDAYREVATAPDWTVRTSTTPVSTSSLPRILQATVKVERTEGGDAWFLLPRALRSGWYVVTVTNGGISRQAILQVTDLATFSLATRTRSLVWVNDLRSNKPVAGARVELAGRSLGKTDAQGLIVGSSPAEITGAGENVTPPLVIVRAGNRTAFVPIATDGYCYSCGSDGRDSWWQLLTLDRGSYRPSDTIHAWGVLRDRSSGDVPSEVSVVLAAASSDSLVPQAAIASASVRPDSTGSFLADLPFTNVPPGGYRVSVLVDGATVGSTWLEIAPIAKPAWKIDLSVSRHAVLSGSSVEITATASFFEGTPVVGAALNYAADSEEEGDGTGTSQVVATTDRDGAARASLGLRVSDDESQETTRYVYVRASEPEEADISDETPVLVFGSTAYLDAESKVDGRKLTITGSVHSVAFDRYEQRGADRGSVDPRGAPRSGAGVQIHVTEIVPVATRTGTRYDFITKEVVPVYDIEEREHDLGSRTVVTRSDGTFRLTRTVTGDDRSYRVRVSYTDEGGRRISVDADRWSRAAYEDNGPRIVATGTNESYRTYRVGDRVRVGFTDGIKHPETQRYLFATLSRGLRAATVQAGPEFTIRFTEHLVPNARITGVRFNGTSYEVSLNGFSAVLDTDDRALQVELSSDRARYGPGARATVSVRTRDSSGRPVAASVFVRAVDEKLFAIGAAWADDPLYELYDGTGSGMVGAAWSHTPPTPEYGGGKGDTTGGGGSARADFRDVLPPRLVRTGEDGRASVTLELSDDLTSWRVLASAVTADLRAGGATVSLPVGLPLFAEAVVAPEYLAADRPTVRLRAYGSALEAGQQVTFRVSSDSLPMATLTVSSTAFNPVEVELPRLSVGTHQLRIQASAGSGSTARSDTLIRPFRVVATRSVMTHTASVALTSGTTVDGADSATRVTLVDVGRGRVVPLLSELATAEPFRADTALAASIARDVLSDAFGLPDDPGLPEPDIGIYQSDDGIALLPYASADLELSAMAAFSGDPQISLDALHWSFRDVAEESAGQLPTDRALYLLLGRASIGEATMSEVTAAAARSDLTAPQRVTVALAALAVGDLVLARQIYLDVLDRHGERLGPWVRVHVGDADQTAVTTARLAIVAAALGDPIAADMDAEIVAHPPADTLVDLERALAARYWADRVPAADATAAVTIDGRRSEVRITAGKPVVLDVTPNQRDGFRIDPVSGSVLVVTDWDGPVRATDLTAPDGQRVTRTVTPSGTIGSTDTVVVTFKVALGAGSEDGCWNLTDFVPSGLAPVAADRRLVNYEDEEATGATGQTEPPWRVVGQRVDFCVERDPKVPVHTLRYLARVVTPGTYRWESAVLQSSVVPDQGAVLPGFSLTIAGLGS
jgi:hypothetical protein